MWRPIMSRQLEPTESALLAFNFPFPQLITENGIDKAVASKNGLMYMNLVLYADSAMPLFPMPTIAYEPENTFSEYCAGVIRTIAYTYAFNKFVGFAQSHDIEPPSYLYPYLAIVAHVGLDTMTGIMDKSQWYFDEKFELIDHIKLLKRAMLMNANAEIYGKPEHIDYFAMSERYKRVMGCTVS